MKLLLENGVTLLTRILTVIAAAAMTAMMFLTAADVALRYFLGSPIPGALELVEFLMAIVVPFSIAYCALHKSHVAVDLVVDHFPGLLKKICRFFVTIPTIIFILLISWQNYLYIFETSTSRLTSAVLKIPSFPFVIPVALGFLVYALIALVQLFPSKPKETPYEPS